MSFRGNMATSDTTCRAPPFPCLKRPYIVGLYLCLILSGEELSNDVTEQTNFKFDAHDLEIIHRAVSRWSLQNGYGVGHQRTVVAARHAFQLYREGMAEDDLIDLLHGLLTTRH